MLSADDLSKLGDLIDQKLDKRFGEFEERVDKKFGEFEVKLDHKLDKRFGEFEVKMDKKLKPIKEDVAKIRGEVKTIVNYFDNEFLDLRRRVEIIESYLKIKTV